MKRRFCLILSISLLFTVFVSFTANADGNLQDGTFTGTAIGMGTVTVEVTIKNDKISNVSIDVTGETKGIGQDVGTQLTKQIIDKQGADIDGVSGATITSNAVRKAVQSCLLQASVISDSDDEDEEFTDIIYFGQYQQEKDKDYYGNSVIEWWPLDINEEEGKLLLVSYCAIDFQPYNSKEQDNAVSWGESSIRYWLNHNFYDIAFTEEEKNIILTTEINNGIEENNPEWDVTGSANTEDKVFLLSAAEYLEYFPYKEKCPYTPYAQDLANKIFKETGSWWLRSPGKKTGEFCAAENGKVSSRNANKATGICPAIWVDYTTDRSAFPFEKLCKAISLEEAREYLAAFEIYDSLGTYEYSYYSAAGSLLEYAVLAEASDDYKGTISRLDAYKRYCDENDLDVNEGYWDVSSYDMMNNAYYQIALREEEAGNYDKAVELFSKLGQYKDCMDRLFTCFSAAKINYQMITSDMIKLVNAGANTDYSDQKNIAKGDPHNGWKLGTFLISGFTEAEEGAVPVFLKKPVDNLALWFSLEQDIDALNGNDKLIIETEKKALDGPFQYPPAPTAFGRGGLLVRHTTSTSEKTNLYENYLVAKGSEDATTHIEIKEEGTYYVALDYLIKDRNLTKALKSTNGYRMSFSFKVKNANGLAYLRELNTGMELQEYAKTENGFRIDFANSKSLKADVVRYALNQTGKSLDIRSNAPASEHDNFKTTGYYVVIITNTETGNITEKHVFIGDDSDLEVYVEADENLALFFD